METLSRAGKFSVPLVSGGTLYSEKKELCRTLRKGSVDFQKLQNVSKVSKKG